MSNRQKEVESTLPVELHTTFHTLVKDYENACKIHVKHGMVWRNYGILGELVRNNWKKNDKDK